MGVDPEHKAEDKGVDGSGGSNNVPGTGRRGTSTGAGEGEEEGMRGEQKHNGGGSMVNFPLCILLPFPLRARLHVDVQATRKTLERLEKHHLRHRARGQNDRIVLEAIDDRGSADERAE